MRRLWLRTILRSPECISCDYWWLHLRLLYIWSPNTGWRIGNFWFYIGSLLNICPITMATEKVSACNVANDCLLQCRCEKIADVLFEKEPHDLFDSGFLYSRIGIGIIPRIHLTNCLCILCRVAYRNLLEVRYNTISIIFQCSKNPSRWVART